MLNYSNKLKKWNKYLDKEDSKVFNNRLNFLVISQENFHYLEKQGYINLAKNFIDNIITADNFSYSLMTISEEVCKKDGLNEKRESG